MIQKRLPAALALSLATASLAFGGAHTWDVNEIFSNADGTIQFIELREMNGGAMEVGVGGHLLTSNTNAFSITSNAAEPTSFRHILFATPGFAALPGAPAPDYVIPVNFLSVTADTISYNPYDSVTFSAGQLPTDGVRSVNHALAQAVNSPTNYAGETGSIDLSPAPPGVPDGSSAGQPMTVEALDASGSSLSIAWDTSSCTGAGQHHLLYGQGSLFPGAPGGALGLTGAVCDLGKTSPFVWNAVPSASDGSGLLWWLIVATDGAAVEGSWGRDSAGAERIGPGAGGSSGQCGVTTRKLSNTCGH